MYIKNGRIVNFYFYFNRLVNSQHNAEKDEEDKKIYFKII